MMFFYRPLAALSILPLLLCQECGDTITAPTSNLSSPNYPEDYPTDLRCEWKISVEDSSRIHLWFTDFEFDARGLFRCYDYLQLRDGGDDKADSLFLSCSESLEDFEAENKGTVSFISSGNTFYLWMQTDSRVNKRGFSATYITISECGDTIITAPSSNLSSPNYPNNYPDDLKCEWTISVEESSRIHLWFTDFEFEAKGPIRCYDYLQLRDGGDDKADSLFLSCSESLEDFEAENKGTVSFISSGNTFYLWMQTDSRVNKRGFSATYITIPEPTTATETVVRSTTVDAQTTLLKRTTEDRTSTPQRMILSTTTPFAQFSSISLDPVTAVSENISTNVPSTIRTTNRSTPTLSVSSDIPSLEPSGNPSSSTLLVVVPTVSLVLLLACLCVTGLFIHTRRSSGKSNTSSNDSSCHDVGTNPVRTVEEQCEPYNKTIYYTNESYHVSPQGTYPPPYQSIKGEDDLTSAQMNVRVLPRGEVIGDVAYESFDEEEKRNSDYTANAGHIANIAYESYGGEKIVGNGDYTANVGEATNIAYESYDTKEIVDNGGYMPSTVSVTNFAYESYDGEEIAGNGDFTAHVGEVSNIAYKSHDGQGKAENDDNVFNEGETSNVVYESYDGHENSRNSDGTENGGEVSNVAYESYDGENNVTYDTDEDSMGYEAIADSQSVDDDYSKITQ